MRSLIIGGAGFVGSYLAKHLYLELKQEVYITKLPNEKIDLDFAHIVDLNILEPEEITAVLNDIRPDHIYHLAAQSSVAVSWKKPQLTLNINALGSMNLLEVLRTLDYRPRVLMIGSGEEYGYLKADELPIKEDNVLRPGNIYSATKAFQNMLSSIYARAYKLDIMSVRAFNHIGPNQMPGFVIPDFCRQVASIEAGLQENCIKVGNLDARRDFTDVRDVVRAYALIMEKGLSGETYNVGSGRAIAIKDILDIILSLSNITIDVYQDPERMRPSDVPVIEADITKLKEATGWTPVHSIEDTIKETLDHWRKKTANE